VQIQAEDVSVQDVAALVTASVTFPADVGVGEMEPFTIEFTAPTAAHAAIRVHIDQTGDGHVRIGDLVTVVRQNAPNDSRALKMVMIPVQLVTGSLTTPSRNESARRLL